MSSYSSNQKNWVYAHCLEKPPSDFEAFALIQDRVKLAPMNNFRLQWLKTSKYPFYDEDGSIGGLIGIATRLEESEDFSITDRKLEKVMVYIEENIQSKISLEDLADMAMMSKNTLLRHFKEEFHISPVAYIKKVRLHLACKMLRNSDKDLSTIAYECGFYDQSHLNKEFKSVLKITPRKYRLDAS